MWILSALAPPVVDERLLLGRVVLAHERQNQLRPALAALVAEADQPLDVGHHLVVVEADARRLEDLLAGGVHADVDRVEPGLDHAARRGLGDQRAVADQADLGDADRLGVADLLDQLAIDERLAVVVHPDVRDAERAHSSAIFWNSAMSMMPCVRAISSRGQNTHLALQMFVLSICTISGRIGASSRPAASSSRRTGFACVRSSSLRASCARAVSPGSSSRPEVVDDPGQDLVELDSRLVADQRADLA